MGKKILFVIATVVILTGVVAGVILLLKHWSRGNDGLVTVPQSMNWLVRVPTVEKKIRIEPINDCKNLQISEDFSKARPDVFATVGQADIVDGAARVNATHDKIKPIWRTKGLKKQTQG
jgi:hypothetical protein